MRNDKIKALGIIGGMGPLADATFLELLHSHTKGSCDKDHIPVIYDGNCLRPDRSDYLMGVSKQSPYEGLRSSLKELERDGASVIAMPCNTAHFWIDRLRKAKRRNTVLINMVYQTCRACERASLKRVCLLSTKGSAQKDIYGKHLFNMGIDLIYPPKETSALIYSLIKDVKCGKNVTFSMLEDKLSEIRCEAFIVGCTELSRALINTEKPNLRYVDGLSALAYACITACKKKPLPFEHLW